MVTVSKLSKHLQECLQVIQSRNVTPFQPIDFYPTIKRGDWVFKKLVEAGKLSKFYVGETAFFQIIKHNAITQQT